MSNISNYDSNFKVETKIEKKDIKFYSVEESPFQLYGIFKENGKFRRMSENHAKKVSDRIEFFHTNTAGGRVRFVTDSSYIAIHTKLDTECVGKMSHFALTGSIGYDLYVDHCYERTFVPPFDIVDGYESICEFAKKEKREITINFPLYSNVKELYIGLQSDAFLAEAKPYKIEKPIVYYGSSITHGGCASRPGMAYPAIVSRELDCDHINLGFSGSAKGETEMADYIKNLEMSVFVYDYDHNAPTVEHLKETHERMFRIIREQQPFLPVVMMSRPKYRLNEEEKIRRSIIETTYRNALAAGDKNVYFIDGEALTEFCKEAGTVDACHPTDLGFFSMANALTKVLATIDL